jgi:hypothetical protein
MIRQTLVLIGALAACKGETKQVDNPETKRALDDCVADKASKEQINARLIDENAKLLKGNTAGAAVEYTVNIQGDILSVKPGGGGGQAPPDIDPKVRTTLTIQFEDIVRKSRGAFQKCYEGALKKRTDLQSKPQMLTVIATFDKDGIYKSSTFTPNIEATFDNCVHAIATHWALPNGSPPINIGGSIELKPT